MYRKACEAIAAEEARHLAEGLVHGQRRLAVAPYTDAVAERLLHGAAQHDGEVFGGVMDRLIERARVLSRDGAVRCHTTAFFAPSTGQALMEGIARATGGSYVKYGDGAVRKITCRCPACLRGRGQP